MYVLIGGHSPEDSNYRSTIEVSGSACAIWYQL